MYKISFDKIVFPVAPESISIKINNQNSTIKLINHGEVNLLKHAGLFEYHFDLLLPNVKYPFAVYPEGYRDADYYLKELKRLKQSLKPIGLLIERTKPNGQQLFETNSQVSIEDYEIKENVQNGFDVVVSIKLKQYKEFKHTILVRESADSDKVIEEKNRSSVKEIPKTYTVKKGDTLWAIAKRELGNGAKYTELAKINNLPNPNLIKIGQVLKLG